METQRDYWRIMRPMGIHETQRDYWTLMRTIRTHETQRLMETNGDS